MSEKKRGRPTLSRCSLPACKNRRCNACKFGKPSNSSSSSSSSSTSSSFDPTTGFRYSPSLSSISSAPSRIRPAVGKGAYTKQGDKAQAKEDKEKEKIKTDKKKNKLTSGEQLLARIGSKKKVKASGEFPDIPTSKTRKGDTKRYLKEAQDVAVKALLGGVSPTKVQQKDVQALMSGNKTKNTNTLLSQQEKKNFQNNQDTNPNQTQKKKKRSKPKRLKQKIPIRCSPRIHWKVQWNAAQHDARLNRRLRRVLLEQKQTTSKVSTVLSKEQLNRKIYSTIVEGVVIKDELQNKLVTFLQRNVLDLIFDVNGMRTANKKGNSPSMEADKYRGTIKQNFVLLQESKSSSTCSNPLNICPKCVDEECLHCLGCAHCFNCTFNCDCCRRKCTIVATYEKGTGRSTSKQRSGT